MSEDNFTVFVAVADKARWLAELAEFPSERQDLYFQPEWIDLHCLEDSARGLAFLYQEGEERWLYPFVRRAIEKIGEEDVSALGLSDIESAYGYGGPISSSDDPEFSQRARACFSEWCRDERIVAEFVRFHPLLQTDRFIGGVENVTIINDRQTAAIPLKGEENPGTYSKNAAYMIRRGARAGYRVIEQDIEMFPRFVQMYRDTMEMLGAADYYYFSDHYYADLAKLVASQGRLLAVVGEDSEEWVSAGLFIDGKTLSHYHLSASITSRRVPGATNLLLDHAAQCAAESGKELLHLGGGRTAAPDDSLLKFKREMGSLVSDFKIGKCLHLPDDYAGLIARWEEQGGCSEGNPVLLRYRQKI